MTNPPTEVRRRLTLPDRIKARQEAAAEKTQAQAAPDGAVELAQAERRVGQLLQAMKRTPSEESGKAGRDIQLGTANDWRTPPKSEYATGIERAGLTPQKANPSGVKPTHRQSLAVGPIKSEYATGIERAGLTPQTTADTVTLPAATWERVRRLAEKGQREREQLQQALAQVEALTAQLKQALQQPVQAMPQAQAMSDDGRLLAMAAALRRRPARFTGM